MGLSQRVSQMSTDDTMTIQIVTKTIFLIHELVQNAYIRTISGCFSTFCLLSLSMFQIRSQIYLACGGVTGTVVGKTVGGPSCPRHREGDQTLGIHSRPRWQHRWRMCEKIAAQLKLVWDGLKWGAPKTTWKKRKQGKTSRMTCKDSAST